jgi:hypothetical protein
LGLFLAFRRQAKPLWRGQFLVKPARQILNKTHLIRVILGEIVLSSFTSFKDASNSLLVAGQKHQEAVMSNIGKFEDELGTSQPRKTTREISSSLAALRSRFAAETNGNVAMTFGLAFVPCLGMVGLAIDYGRMSIAAQQTQSILDASALSGARAFQQASNGQKLAKAIAAQESFWAGMLGASTASGKGSSSYAIPNSTRFETPIVGPNDTDITFRMSQWVRTPFMSPLEMFGESNDDDAEGGNDRNVDSGKPASCANSQWACRRITQSSTVKMKQSGASEGETLEISMMLDITGSMREMPGTNTQLAETDTRTKLMIMKRSAKAFVDIILPSEDTSGRNRVALVPFSSAVYVGNTVAEAVTPPLETTCGRNVAGCKTFNFTTTKDQSKTTTRYRSQNCVTVRTGTQAYTDASYTAEATPAEHVANRFNSGPDNGWGDCGLYDSNNPERNKIMPLTGNPDNLKDAIDAFTTSSNTAGQIGTAWAWYMLSPNWANLWDSGRRPAPYGSTVKKVAVLMTDGEYNTQYCKGVDTDTKISKSETQRGSACTTIDSKDHALALCTGMKNAGITVYTVALDVDTGPRDLLRSCATSTAHAYYANNESTLMSAFQDIALRTSLVLVSK